MSGAENLNTAKNQLDKWDKLLDEYEQKLGLEPTQEWSETGSIQKEFSDIDEVTGYLQLSRDAVEALTPNQAASIAFVLERYAFYLQRAQNRETARVNWATSTLNSVIGPKIDQYSGYGWKEKAPKAIQDDAFASKLDSIRKYAQQRVDRLQFVAASIKNLANILKVKQWKD